MLINDRKRTGTARNGQERSVMVKNGERSAPIRNGERSGTVNGQERLGTVNGQERIVENGHCTVTVRSRYGQGHASKSKETLYLFLKSLVRY